MNDLVPITASQSLPALVTAAGEGAQLRVLEFFAASIRNAHTRRAYAGAVDEFLAWCEGRGVASIAAVQPLHVAAYIEALSRARSAPTAKLRLAAIRRLFDWLVVGQVMPHNPAAAVRGHCDIAVLTRSEHGANIVTATEMLHAPAAPVAKVVDTTGAGDLYAAGFLFGLTHGRDLVTCGKLGALCAAEIISHFGARPETSLKELAHRQGLL